MTNGDDGASQKSDRQPSANIANQEGTQGHHNPPLDRAINDPQATPGQPENEATKHQPPASIPALGTAFLPASEGPGKQVGPAHRFLLAKCPSLLPFPSELALRPPFHSLFTPSPVFLPPDSLAFRFRVFLAFLATNRVLKLHLSHNIVGCSLTH